MRVARFPLFPVIAVLLAAGLAPGCRRQLVAGYSTTSPDLGLVAVMPDADEADRPLAPRAALRSARR